MSRLGLGGRTLLTGRNGKTSPRFPPQSVPQGSRQQRSAAVELKTLNTNVKPERLYDLLAGTSENPAPSKFGGTTLERAADNAAALLGFAFDAAQVKIDLTISGTYTVVDRMLFQPTPGVLLYMDGIQHDLRLNAAQQDFIQALELREMGYKVLRIKQADMERDPLYEIRKVLFAE